LEALEARTTYAPGMKCNDIVAWPYAELGRLEGAQALPADRAGAEIAAAHGTRYPEAMMAFVNN
jgi:hypothetical protein